MKTNCNENNVAYQLKALINTYGIATVLIELGKVQESTLLTSSYVLDISDNQQTIDKCILVDADSPALRDKDHPYYGKVMIGDNIPYDAHVKSSIAYDEIADISCEEVYVEIVNV